MPIKHHSNLVQSLKIALISGAALYVPGAALAQEVGDTADASNEIIVTAQKRSQSIRDIGMSIQALDSSKLDTHGVATTADLGKVVPGLSVTPAGVGNSGAPVYTLRGIGFYEKSLSAVSAVAFYADEVPLPYAYMTAGPTLDLSRVEVLKGPQGTLYGQNSTGGAINFIANKPTSEFHAGAEVSYGRFDRIDGEAFVSGPLSDSLRARVAVRAINSAGWQYSESRPNDDLGASRSYAARAILDWTPSDTAHVELTYNGWWDRSESQGAQVTSYHPNLQDFTLAAFYPFYNNLFDPDTLRPNNSRQADWNADENYRNRNKLQQVALRVNFEVAPAIDLTSISSYSDFNYRTFQDTDGSPLLFNQYTGRGAVSAYSQEVRLTGENWDNVTWILGVNFARDKIKDLSDARLNQSTLGFFANLSGTIADQREKRTTKAAFANVDFKISPTLTFSAGIRATKVKLDFDGCVSDNGDGTGAGVITGGAVGAGECLTLLQIAPVPAWGRAFDTLKEDNISWRGGFTWKPTNDATVYTTISRGFKSGNFPNIVAISASQYAPVVQEKVTAYEGGVKLRLLDGALDLNGAAYYMNYVNKQLYGLFNLPIIGISESTVNIPKSRVYGAEVELIMRPLDGLTLSANANYTDTKITEGPASGLYIGNSTLTWSPVTGAPAGFVGQAPSNLNGLEFNLSPKWQAAADASYEWEASSSLKAFVGSSASYRSSMWPLVGTDPLTKIPSYFLVDARLGIGDINDGWKVTFWGRNITNKHYIVSVQRGFDSTGAYSGMPATYGVTLGLKI